MHCPSSGKVSSKLKYSSAVTRLKVHLKWGAEDELIWKPFVSLLLLWQKVQCFSWIFVCWFAQDNLPEPAQRWRIFHDLTGQSELRTLHKHPPLWNVWEKPEPNMLLRHPYFNSREVFPTWILKWDTLTLYRQRDHPSCRWEHLWSSRSSVCSRYRNVFQC